MAITNGYCTLADLKEYLKITSVDTNDDTMLEDIIEAISRRIDSECNRHFYQVTEARYFHTNSRGVLYVGDIATTSGLEIKSSRLEDGSYQYTWAATDYNLLPYSPRFGFPYTHIEISEYSDYSFSGEKMGNKVTATWGWAAVPDDVKMVCLNESGNEYRRRFGDNPNGTATITAAGVVITPQGLSKSSVQSLLRYRKMVL